MNGLRFAAALEDADRERRDRARQLQRDPAKIRFYQHQWPSPDRRDKWLGEMDAAGWRDVELIVPADDVAFLEFSRSVEVRASYPLPIRELQQ